MLTSLNMVMHGWANYFRHAVAKNTFGTLDNFTWWRMIRMLRERHHWTWSDVRRRFVTASGQWQPITAGENRAAEDQRDPGDPVSLPQHSDPLSLAPATDLTAETVESPLR